MQIDYLAHHRHLLPEVTDLVYDQWAEMFQAGGTSRDRLEELFVERAVSDRLPLTLVALDGDVLAGTGSIKLSEPGTKAGLSPWLAGVIVKDAFRGAGVGTMLVKALELNAVKLGVQTLHLSVGAATKFYEGLGWTALERINSYGVKDVTLMAKDLALAKPSECCPQD